MNSKKVTERFGNIDLLRGIACIAVVMFHFFYRGQKPGWIVDSPIEVVKMVSSYGYLGVHLFFMISGFVIFMSAQGATGREFVASRASRLYPAFWVAVTLTALVEILMQDSRFTVTLGQYLANMTMLSQFTKYEFIDGAYWSLAVEIQFYVMVYITIKLGLIKKPELLLVAWMLVATVYAIHTIHIANIILAAKYASLFTAGIIYYLVHQSGWNTRRALLLLWSYVITIKVHGGNQVDLAIILSTFYAVFYLISAGKLSVRRNVFVVWAGLLTYPLYVLHQNIGYLLIESGALRHIDLHVRVLIVVALIILVAVAINRLVERPLGKWMRLALTNGFRKSRPAPRLAAE